MTPSHTDDIDISVVICFKNWGQQRLLLAIKSIRESFGSLRGEVIVADYGSDDGQVTREAIEDAGAAYTYITTDGTWSRSRALNAGFALARGEVLCSTDADMIFTPGSFEYIGQTILNNPFSCLLVQCRDLPEEWDDDAVARQGFQWDLLHGVSRLRPRWGMGGMMAVHRAMFERIRGLDERMHTYGGEDIDFATRARRAGCAVQWVEEPSVRMYHMWHPSSAKAADLTEEGRRAVEENKRIMRHDRTIARNTVSWEHRLPTTPPLVSVAIATHNRADLLAESITSVLAQTVQDFEIIVVDDGSTDNTQEVVESFNDPRIRYFYQEPAGVAAARNRATDESRGQFIAVQDDDDLMLPWRLERQLAAITEGNHGSFGAFVNFDNASGDLHLIRSRPLTSATIVDNGGAPGHGTWLLDRRVLENIRYDETLDSGIDNNVALRLTRAGFTMQHCGEIVMLRRMHPGQITVLNEHNQKQAARQTRKFFEFSVNQWCRDRLEEEAAKTPWPKVRLDGQLDALLPYLPDHLVERRLQNVATPLNPDTDLSQIPDALIVTRGEESFVLFSDQEPSGPLFRQILRSGQFDLVTAKLRPRVDTEEHTGLSVAETERFLTRSEEAHNSGRTAPSIDSISEQASDAPQDLREPLRTHLRHLFHDTSDAVALISVAITGDIDMEVLNHEDALVTLVDDLTAHRAAEFEASSQPSALRVITLAGPNVPLVVATLQDALAPHKGSFEVLHLSAAHPNDLLTLDPSTNTTKDA